MKDVREIHDIPNIETQLNLEFELILYELGDNIQIYHHSIDSRFYFNLEIHSQEKLIEGRDKLINLITQDDIGYLELSLMEKATGLVAGESSWCYRPLVNDKNKNYETKRN